MELSDTVEDTVGGVNWRSWKVLLYKYSRGITNYFLSIKL